jgi:hypothetical protein
VVTGTEPATVHCRSWNPPGSPFASPASAVASITLRSGAVASYRATLWTSGEETAFSGMWRMSFEGGEAIWRSHADASERSAEADALLVRERGRAAAVLDLPRSVPFGRAATLRAFADAVRTRRLDPLESSGEDNLWTLAFTNAAIASARSGAEVRVDDVLAGAA